MEKFTRFKYAPLMIFQIILMVLFFVFVTYETKKGADIKGYEDTHVMIFIGFGFLMTFLKKYSYSALGFNWFLAALCIQWALLCQSFYSMENNTIYISKKSLFEADVMSATVLITFGAVLGIASGTQLLLIAIVEIAVGCLNFYIIDEIFEASDVGGSIGIHTFGAYFGLGVSSALRIKKGDVPEASRLDGPNYQSDVTAMIGSLFLWIYWPSFNSALTSNDVEYQRAVINTYLSLAAATVTAFVISSMVSHKKGKFDMVHIQNSTLAGGVAIGAICNLYICPGIAIAVGILAGMLSVLGYRFLTPALEKIGLQDTCGVNNLHGMPGVFSALLSVLFAGLATSATYGTELSNIFPAMTSGRTAGVQALYQLAALGVTLALSYGSGFITGLIAKQPIFDPLKESDRYDDEINWELPTP